MPLPRPSTVRITLLLAVLVIVGFTSLHQSVYTRNWTKALQVTVFPINGDGHQTTDAYIKALSNESFSAIDRWGIREAKRHDLDLPIPFEVTLGEQIMTTPPPFPEEAHAIDVLIWGLRFRYWAWKNTPDDNKGLTRVRMFVVYQSSDEKPLQHSLGMQKGLMGIVFARSHNDRNAQNNIVIAHEMLHTVSATDKYGISGHPLYPHGYANILRKPLHPQRSAEIMAVRIPTSSYRSHMAVSLRSVLINDTTAGEINWLQ